MSRTGGCSAVRSPRRIPRERWYMLVARYSAVSSSAAANAGTPTMTCGIEVPRGAELMTINGDRLEQVARREVRRESVRAADARREVGAVQARSQDPNRHFDALARDRA